MSIHTLLKPVKSKVVTLNSLTRSVIIKSTTADDTHLKRPNVIKLRGNKSIFMIGFAKSETKAMAIPARSSVFAKDPPKIMPEATRLAIYIA